MTDLEKERLNFILKEYRCPICHKLFFLAKLNSALIKIKCKNCKRVIKIVN